MTQPSSPPVSRPLPLAGVRVVEFSHMVMGPTCGMILGDLGAEVIKIEPLAGDNTRRLIGSGSGFFRMFNRNKQSVALDIATPKGKEIAHKLIAIADVVSENFKPGLMAKHGLDYATLAKLHPRLVYILHKGFLPGPYDQRTALDEVVQMMGGLAYMTGPPGRPLRAGSSVNDIMGGMFGAIGALAALRERDTTGQGQEVQAGLFESCVLLAGQHMQQFAVTGKPAPPMPGRNTRAWGVYDIFDAVDGQIFLAVVTDTQWPVFCKCFGFSDLAADERLDGNNKRVVARDWMIPQLQKRLAGFTVAQLQQRMGENGLPFAPIVRPDQLFEDPHLLASGGLDTLVTDTGVETQVPTLPISLGGRRLKVRRQLPTIGAQTREVLASLGYKESEIAALAAERVVGLAKPAGPAK